MKNKAITFLAIIIVSLLTFSFFIGDSGEVVPLNDDVNERHVAVSDPPLVDNDLTKVDESGNNDEEEAIEANKRVKQQEAEKEEVAEKKEDKSPQPNEPKNQIEEDQPKKSEIQQQVTTNKENPTPTKPKEPEKKDSKEEKTQEQKKEKENIIAQDNAIKEKDQYLTDPVPEGKPGPVEWQKVEVEEDKELTATLTVSAKTILNNMDLFNEDKLEVLPEDGVIFPKQTVSFYEGESVFDVLLREMQNNKIHMEFVMTPMYNSHYIEGINNLYEFDCGELSGWMYKVNGWFPNYGASRYKLEDQDAIEWVYTCDLGRDIGGYGASTGGAG